MDEFIFQMEVISIHAPPRGATFSICPSIHVSVFQFTPLREGRRNRCRTLFRVSEFQFTPLREGRHSRRVLTDRRRISIHAPPRGATGSSCTGRKLSGAISIHAPPRGATHPLPPCRILRCISIHAPPRGATFTESTISCATENFNSRPSARGDKIAVVSSPTVAVFQFTPLREGRPVHQRGNSVVKVISIHAPPRGATFFDSWDEMLEPISIHAPPRGATSSQQRVKRGHIAFQFTPLREGRRENIAARCFFI